jgi:hypothetical protein
MAAAFNIKGFLDEPKRSPSGDAYRGRLQLPLVQWTGKGPSAFVTFTVTAEQVADAAESQLLWTDQAVQRGVQPTAPPGTPAELAVGDGYPNPALYVFHVDNADDICEKLIRGEDMFLNPLVWNLRPGQFEAYSSEETSEIWVYHGRIYLPDSHHRHQAILKAVRSANEGNSTFDRSMQFKVELYFVDKEGEGNYFFDKNQRTRPTSKAKAYDLTTQDDLSLLAKRVLEKLPDFNAGVNRVTDRLSKKAPHFVTLSTLREMMRNYAGASELEEAELEGLAVVAADFLDMISHIRPELSVQMSHTDRDRTLAASGVMMHAYAALMHDYNLEIPNHGREAAKARWGELLERLAPGVSASYVTDSETWAGDFLSKENPLWADLGIAKSTRKGPPTILNTGGTRARASKALREHLGLIKPVDDESDQQ